VSARLDLSVVVPAHNEGPNLQLLLPQLRTILEALRIETEVLVVVREADAETRAAVGSGLATIVEQREPGYGGALRTGFALARGRYVLSMDADLSHPPTFVADLWKRRDEAEILVGSRYVQGGDATMPLVRALLSRVLNRFFARGLGVPLRDLSSGFRLYRTGVLDMRAVTARDFDVLPEIVVRAYTEGWRVQEIPFHYEPRAHGSSNARIIPFGLAYARTFRRLWSLRNSVLSADYEDRAFASLIPLQRYWQRRRYRHVTRFLEADRRTLDVGCGSSRILGALPRGSVGVDLLIRKLRHARRFGRQLVQASALGLPFRDGSFACVVSSQLLEVLPRGMGALAEMGRVLAPGGRLILATPDYGRLRWILLGALYQRLVPGADASRHLARYTKRELVSELGRLGYELDATRSILGAEVILAFRKPGALVRSAKGS
jgi:dolichol-phosphate mannosyltransferase